MRPTLVPGDRVVAVRRWRPVRVGDIVLVADPREPSRWLVKRCAAVRDHAVTLRGDNDTASTDSRTFGDVPEVSVRWVVLSRRQRERS